MKIINFILCLTSSALAVNVLANQSLIHLNPEEFSWNLTNTTSKAINIEYLSAIGNARSGVECKVDKEHPLKTIVIAAKST